MPSSGLVSAHGVAVFATSTGVRTTMSETECPTCGKDDFDTETAMKVHHSLVHGESLVKPEISECNHCGAEFEVGENSTGKYCSLKCMGLDKRDRIERTCIHCDEQFEVPPSEADQKFCTQQCRTDSMPSKYEYRSCEMCERNFKTIRSGPAKYCCRSCESEVKAEKPRPENTDMLLWLLYVYEGFNHHKTWERQRAVIGSEGALTKAAVKERLLEMGVFFPAGQTRRALESMDPNELGGNTPDGNDSWKDYYQNRDRGEADD